MKPLLALPAMNLILTIAIAIVVVLMGAVAFDAGRERSELDAKIKALATAKSQVIEAIETEAINYEELSGLDPDTQRAIDLKARSNDLEFRVDKLEGEVRRLNQIVLRIPTIRVGAENADDTPKDTDK